MGVTLLALAILAGVGWYLTTPDERRWLGGRLLALIRRAADAAAELSPSRDPFHDALRARTRWVLVTPLLVAVHAVVLVLTILEPGAAGDPGTLIAWGGNFAPRTLDGEWWRLFTAFFVHAGVLHVLASTAGLIPLGLVLERALGPGALAGVYVASGVLSSGVGLWLMPPMGVAVGASGAICGLYGLLVATVLWTLAGGLPDSAPVTTAKQIGCAGGIFALHSLLTTHLPAGSEVAGFLVGLGAGAFVARGVSSARPPLRRAGQVLAGAMLVACIGVFPLRVVPDRVTPEILRIVAAEERTAVSYEEAVVRFRKNRITADGLVRVIEETILPELHTARGRLRTLEDVPSERVPLVAAAEEYINLRELSWRRRAEGLMKSDLRKLREADETEQKALARFRTMKPAG